MKQRLATLVLLMFSVTVAAQSGARAEKVAAFESMAANTGTYDISGTTLTVRPMVAKNPNCSAGPS